MPDASGFGDDKPEGGGGDGPLDGGGGGDDGVRGDGCGDLPAISNGTDTLFFGRRRDVRDVAVEPRRVVAIAPSRSFFFGA
ncbi:hypothetical protein [Albimonas pacifica]|uniref:Uncharacterized protein n=1 Tax=Albimonas pacifica TaxID=1114924 RepID=A0A1I3FHY9_9RHOB|nr:hypothetical protein [Albimonas pacifica]SFI10777.1 hypothetical protein SAMN05216258_104294 [Albimonas pacifica]